MSAVALPHVPSARAPSSAASSTRRSLHSAGSTASHVSSKSLRRSNYGEEDDNGDGGENEEDASEDDDEEEEPHESSSGSTNSGGIWDEVESFLNKPSPSFVALAKETVKSTSVSTAGTLPTIRAGDRKQPVAPSGGGNQSGSRASRPAVRQYTKPSSSGAGSKSIDPKLLQEAFAYAEKIQRVSLDDEDDETNGEHEQQRDAERRGVGMLRRDTSFGSTATSSNGPRMPHDTGLQKQGSLRTKADEKPKKKVVAGAKTSAYGVSVKPQLVKKKPSGATSNGDRRASKDASGWDASPSSADPTGDGMAHSRKGSVALDQQTIQSLVSNLQNGTALDELRRELTASQQSMAMSRQVIQEAAKSFFRK